MNHSFFEEYLSNLKDYNKIPKLQIERAISPLLSIFIEELIKGFVKNNDRLCGNIKMVLPEFPLKKENNQSTNIDWLLINKEKKVLLFIELKTATSSYNPDQLETYRTIQEYILRFGAKFLYDDIRQIRDNSSEKSKYDFILQELQPFKPYFENIRQSEVIYIVPTTVKNKISDLPVLSFSEFPEHLNHNYEDEWVQLRKFFLSIDDTTAHFVSKIKKQAGMNESIKMKIGRIEHQFNKTPKLIWFGITGQGSNPNFQIQFTDGTIKPFHSSGKEYTRATEFERKNLSGPFYVNEL